MHVHEHANDITVFSIDLMPRRYVIIPCRNHRIHVRENRLLIFATIYFLSFIRNLTTIFDQVLSLDSKIQQQKVQ